ncbi:MAG: tRNA (N6-isopentenyl adenosine(37)-C2)-methylthiotransferase MiaB [Desulfuromonadales bacterium]|nr:tRNA (N6-isopentenyl adenosine(37)-C2)-methylthiotransferase MiaB [Desulfuromonadales bacterium]
MNKTFFLETFGCQMNVVDSERICHLLAEIGYYRTEHVDNANLILLNTCSVRDKAERKVYGHLGSFKPLKSANPELIIGVGGCVAQQEGEQLLTNIPFLDLVFGTHNIHKLPAMVTAVEQDRVRCHETDFLDRETRLQLWPNRADISGGVTRFVTIMQGCDNFCSFCIVPHVRGREISRPSTEIIREIEGLAAQGVKEVTLIGQNVNSYGGKDETEISFAELLRKVALVEGIERLRFTTSHPKDLSDDLIATFSEIDTLCNHLHLPVQCGSSPILKRMNRGYTREDYLKKVAKLRQARPDIRLTSDIIVGFPGETKEDAAATLSLIEQVRYADLYLFQYSPRPGTAAAALVDDISKAVKQERFDRMLAMQRTISQEVWNADVGTTLPVLVEGHGRQKSGQLFGRTTWNRIVNFTGDDPLIGSVQPVRIIKSLKNSQLGELL